MKYNEKSIFNEKNFMQALLNAFISIFKWIELALCVFTSGVVISFLIICLLKGETASHILLNRLFSLGTGMFGDEVATYLIDYGIGRFATAGFFYGATRAFVYGLKYAAIRNLQDLCRSFNAEDKLFTRENLDLIDATLPYTFFIALTPPIILYIISDVIGIFQEIDADVSGLIFVLFAFFIKLVFEKGYEETKKLTKTDRLLSDAKAVYSELKMEVIAKDAQLKSKVKELTKIKEEKAKKEVKKEEAKEEPKKRKPRTKKK